MNQVVNARRVRIAAFVTALALVVAFLAPAPAAVADEEYGGALPNGAIWRAVVPSDWNGTLLLYSHGYAPSFVPLSPAVAPDGETETALLELGYALAGSSYAANGWALPTAAADQLATLDAAIAAIGAEPDSVLAYGSSMGGLVTAQLAESAGDVIDGALPTCGIVAGGVDLNNYQLDGAHAINELLAPGVDIQLVGYSSFFGDAQIATAQLVAAVEEGQASPEGRARVALAAALYQLPDWLPADDEPSAGDDEARQAAMYEWLVSTLPFVTPARADLVAAAGGDSGWNEGVDYRRLFRESPERQLVATLYREAGLALGADLDLLTATADLSAEPSALQSMLNHSHPDGDLAMPVFSLHTTDDNLVPVQHEEEYADDVRSHGKRSLLRQSYVARPGHCAFTSAEVVAGLKVLEDRVTTGHWGPAGVSSKKLNDLAESLGLGGSAFVNFQPGEFIGDRSDQLSG